MNYVIWDVETDSADTNYATIIEIGAILLDKDLKVVARRTGNLPQDQVGQLLIALANQ